MERSEISLHEVRLYSQLLSHPKKWFTNRELADAVGFSERTVRAHTLRFCGLGIIDHLEVFPAHKYRISDKATKRNQAYVQRLDQAMDAFGLNNGVANDIQRKKPIS